ncbi:hypothetical protein LFML04_2013 [Leptospirillum ferriphilum ML-04]|uniref:Uncharacterized protein n=1 Tax=Leptospirillum ferriphilum (strain ML-04) TaxID=1048260 RepID=J9ZDJ2_LEPFM|nr:hypothetical protein LFML04_2013 [Leptospirillum ferriphilum ML-04]
MREAADPPFFLTPRLSEGLIPEGNLQYSFRRWNHSSPDSSFFHHPFRPLAGIAQR